MKDIELWQGDCLELMKNIPDKSIDLILTDPPYLISKRSGYTNCSADRTDYISKYGKHTIDFGDWDKKSLDLEQILKESYRILKPNGTFICFYDFWKIPELKEVAELIGFKQPRLGCWNKTNPVPINSKINYLSNAKEFFITFVKKSKPTFNSEYDNAEYYVPPDENGMVDNNTDKCDTYFLPIVHGKERYRHPTQKPLRLMSELINKHSNENDMVLDFFAGSGTTGVACKNLNRKFIGIELDEGYFKVAKERIENT